MIELGKIVGIKRNSIKPEDIKNETFYVGLEHINNLGIVNGVCINRGELASNKFIFNKGDILYGKLRPYLKKITLATKEGICSTDIIPIKVKPNVSPNYVCYLLRSDRMVNEANSRTSGANLPRISPKEIIKLKIPLPPLAEQKRIAKILDQADQLRQLNQQILAQYDALTKSLFLDMFGDPVVNPMGWEIKNIENIVVKRKGAIKRGPFGGALKKEIFVKEGYLVYEQYHALNNDFSMARYFIDENKFNELKGFELKAKDIIISCSGVNLGRLAIVPNNARKGIINQALLKITLDEKIMNNIIFIYIFENENFKAKFFGTQRGSGVPNFPPMATFKRFEFILPPISLQNKFAEKIKNIEAQKANAQAALTASEDLFNNLLQKAFKGEL